MNEKNTKNLLKNYPKIFVQHTWSMTDTAIWWLFECGDGWYKIIDALCKSIQNHVDCKIKNDWFSRKNNHFSNIFRGWQHGWKRFSWWHGFIDDFFERYKEYKRLKEPFNEKDYQVEATQVKEKFGGLRFYVNVTDYEVDGMITVAETLSYMTCEVCGKDGKPRGKGWISTTCDKCDKNKEKMKIE